MNTFEASRLYQAALEEQRIVRNRTDELIPHEAIEAQEHMDNEVQRGRADLLDALFS